jgi:Flp pilus assembly protein TadG
MSVWFSKALARLARFAADRRGVAAVEMAILMPVLLMLMSGLVEVARAYEQASAIEKGLRAGALYLARTGDPTAMAAQTAASDLAMSGRLGGGAPYLAPGWSSSAASLDISFSSFTVGEDSLPVVRLAAEVPFVPLVPGLAETFGFNNYTIRLSHEQAYVGI